MIQVYSALAAGAVLVVAGLVRRALLLGARGTAVRRVLVRSGGLARSWQPARSFTKQAKRHLPSPPVVFCNALINAGIGATPTIAWSGWLATLVFVPLVAGVLAGPGTALLSIVGVMATPVVALRTRRDEADRRIEAGVPGAMEAVARSLRTGASMRQALDEAAIDSSCGLGAELGTVTRGAGHGATLVGSLEQLAIRRPLAAVRLAVAALCLGIETGGSQAEAIDGVAVTLRERQAVSAELRALSSQARISALVIGVAPLAFGAFTAATDPRTFDFVFHTGLGLVLLTAGLSLDTAGWLWMRRLSVGG